VFPLLLELFEIGVINRHLFFDQFTQFMFVCNDFCFCSDAVASGGEIGKDPPCGMGTEVLHIAVKVMIADIRTVRLEIIQRYIGIFQQLLHDQSPLPDQPFRLLELFTLAVGVNVIRRQVYRKLDLRVFGDHCEQAVVQTVFKVLRVCRSLAVVDPFIVIASAITSRIPKRIPSYSVENIRLTSA